MLAGLSRMVLDGRGSYASHSAVRYAKSLLVSALLASLTAVAGCSVASDDEDTGSAADSRLTGKTVTLAFRSDFTTDASAPLVKGEALKIAYDPNRLTACRGDQNGGPGWTIDASYRLNGGPVKSLTVAGHQADPTATPTFPLTGAGDLELWFENDSLWGCDAYDSNYGKNYHFTVLASDDPPGWMGDAQVVTSRATCNDGGPCDADFHDLGSGFTYDTWTRERAAIREAYFQVWKQGVTDFDNGDLWKELDVEVHSRIGDVGDFTMGYVAFDTRLGHNARYALDLRTLDPLAAPGGGNGSQLTDKSQCPTFPVTYEGTGAQQMIDADVQFYFTVNGQELRPADGGVFHGKYQSYGGVYSICQNF